MYDPGISYHGDNYLYGAISGLGTDAADAWKKTQDLQKQAALNDSIIQHAVAVETRTRIATGTADLLDFLEIEWPAGYADVALEIYGEGMPLPRRFADLAPSVRARIQAKAAQNFNETERSLNTGK